MRKRAGASRQLLHVMIAGVGRSAPVAYVKNAIATNDAVRMLALYLIRGIEFDIATAKGEVRRFALDTVLTSILR